jgi:hypothetical protein
VRPLTAPVFGAAAHFRAHPQCRDETLSRPWRRPSLQKGAAQPDETLVSYDAITIVDLNDVE